MSKNSPRYFEINEQGHNIRCKLYCQDPRAIRSAVIFCHGFGGHKDNSAAAKFALKLMAKHKSAALITFNWPCHGDDVKKKLSLADCDTYLTLLLEYVKTRFAPEVLCCYATSFGGYLALKYIYEHGNPFRRVALRCPAVDMHRVLSRSIITPEELDKLSRGKDVLVGFDRKVPVSAAFLEELRSFDLREKDFLDYAEDLLIIHGTADEIVAYADAYSFSDDKLIEFVPIEGADHRFRNPLLMDLAIKAILEFFSL